MKRKIIITVMLLLSCKFIFAQAHPYNVVFDITSKDTVDHRMVIRFVNEVLKADSNANIEVVFYGKSLDMITQGKSIVADELQRLSSNKNVAFRACAIAMKNNNIDKSQLLPGVQTVPDGIYEIISKQREGWGYIKAAR